MHTPVRRAPVAPRRRLAACGAALVLGLVAAGAARAACSLKTMEMPVKMIGDRAVATVGINGRPVPLVVDTGAFFSVLGDAAAAELDLPLRPLPYGMEIGGITGRAVAHATTARRVTLVKGEIPDIDFVVTGNEDGNGTMGLMGRNLLSFADTEYDLAHGMVRFVFPSDGCEKSNMAYWAGESPVAVLELLHAPREKRPAIRAEIELNGRRATALFDTGATTMVNLAAAHRAGVRDEDMIPNGRTGGIGRGWVKEFVASFDKVDLGDEQVLHNRLAVADLAIDDDLLIGIDFFLSHRVYVSRQQSRMFYTYGGGPVFALTVTRALVEAGVPSRNVFAAAFGSEQPVADNADADGRSRNRRVEMAPTPRPARAARPPTTGSGAHA